MVVKCIDTWRVFHTLKLSVKIITRVQFKLKIFAGSVKLPDCTDFHIHNSTQGRGRVKNDLKNTYDCVRFQDYSI